MIKVAIYLKSSWTVWFQAWFAFDNDTFFMADDHYLVIDIGSQYEFDSYKFMKEELDITHSLIFVTSKTLTRES